MDILFLLVGIWYLLKGRYDWVLFLIIFLGSSWMQMTVPDELSRPLFPFPHQVSDTGLLLYVFFILRIIQHHRIKLVSPQSAAILVFFVYLIASCFIDYYNHVLVSDMILFLRPYFYLTIIFFAPYVPSHVPLSVLKKVYYTCMAICALLLFQRFSGFELIAFRPISAERGVKAPVYAIICGFLAFVNVLKVSRWRQVVHCALFILPIVLNQKMTYLTSIVLLFVAYHALERGFRVSRLVGYLVLTTVAMGLLFAVMPQLEGRLLEFQSNVSNFGTTDYGDNLSFRLAHSYERLTHILGQGLYGWFRGVGFVSESHYNAQTFMVGLNNEQGYIIQLDTGDIAWSIWFLRFGVIGTLLFVWLILRMAFQLIKVSTYGKMFGTYLLVALFFQSFGNAVPTYGFFYMLPILFLYSNAEVKSTPRRLTV